MLGWNANLIQAWMLSKNKQYMFFLMETIDKQSKFLCTVIYASNSGIERRQLWKELENQKIISYGVPWIILGDFNVTMKASEHSNGGSSISNDMMEFIDCVNSIEVDDLHSEGFFYTWTKSLKNPNCRTLKKLDRVMMVNEVFLEKYQQAHGAFLPYLVSDHSPIIVNIPNGVKKEEFIQVQVVQKLKALKGNLKNMSWQNGNVFERVEILKEKVKGCQTKVDKYPHDREVKEESVRILEEYIEAKKEEYNLLCQKAKDINGRSDIFISKLTNDEAMEMVRPISDAEIKNAMFGIEDSKAPGPDGYTSRFYKSGNYWESKILTNRIKKGLGMLVSENQSAFIEGRQVTDNIMLSQELFRGYNKKLSVKKVAFKIDLQKAYDTISWNFLKSILGLFGFHEKMVHWIMTCVTSAKFSINVSGERIGYFKGGRGLRQGDPISPYLFTLVMEVLTLIIKKNIESAEEFRYHYGCKRLKITSLCFADDLLVFCHGDCDSVRVIKKSLDEFSSFSGLLPNMQKSSVFFGGLSVLEQQRILDIIPFNMGKFPVKYLGVPLITKKIGVKECKPLVDK
ncbi:RNA-directed DNA polymerase, eukaryota, reverse transcriptase zinc-binding domain protein, partial [Tanacetum coccineum]